MLCLCEGLYIAFFASPEDYQQGGSVRIMYVHVPAAWMALFTYSTIAISSIIFLIWRHPIADIIARSSGVVGAGFCLITLITGAIWGKPMWGAWWVWDARLTSMLILFFIYLGYIAVASQANNDIAAQKISAVLAIIGFINIPIIKFSVDWWSTLHQPASVFRMQGSAIDSSMLLPLLIMALAFTFFYLSIVIYEIRTNMLSAKLRRYKLR
jgi:heme exporter protein C